jgi:hypothetical protein
MKLWTTFVAAALLVCGASASAGKGDGAASSQHQNAVEDLPVCYARGTDLLGRAVNAVDTLGDLDSTINVGDPEFDAALALYRDCFSKDFAFTLQFDGVTVLTVPDPATRTEQTDAALQWANFVNNAFRAPGYRSTQHHMGSISSEIQGDTAHVISYLIATHVFGADGDQPEGSTSVVGGTYTDESVKQNGHWVIKDRTLNITSSVVTVAQ